VVSRAFQILSDPEKKEKFDRYGGDPDSRFGAGAGPSSPFSSASRGGGGMPQRGGNMWEEEISPEEIFNRFFSGGMGGFGGFGEQLFSYSAT
jgi:DnaJ homolog subfamily B member 12